MKLKNQDTDAPSDDRSELGERVARSATPGQKVVGGAAAVAAVLMILGGVGYKYWYLPSHQTAAPAGFAAAKQDTTPPKAPPLSIPPDTSYAQAPMPGLTQPASPANSNPLPPGMQPTPQQLANTPQGSGANAQAEAQERAQEEARRKAIRDRKFASDMGGMPGRADSAMMPASMQAGAGGGATVPASLTGGGGGTAPATNDFSAKLIPTSTPRVQASYIPNPSLTVVKGTPIRCTMDTAMNSDTPGFVSCTVSKPVYGMDGTVVLIEPGSTVDGELPKGPDRGKKRAAVLWGRIVTPKNITMAVNSPGTDTLGAAGLTGSIDNHYCERFCGAFLFSSFQDLMQVGVQAASKSGNGNTNIVLPQNTMNSGQNAAGEILNQGRDVQPTFTKNQGDEITITVARDLDFSSAYELKATN